MNLSQLKKEDKKCSEEIKALHVLISSSKEKLKELVQKRTEIATKISSLDTTLSDGHIRYVVDFISSLEKSRELLQKPKRRSLYENDWEFRYN